MTAPARQVGHYRLGEVIGVGSFATVHRARDERLQDEVVVKILAENHSLNPEIRERFIAEGRSLRKVSSPHVVQDRKSTRLNSSHVAISYAVFCLKKK